MDPRDAERRIERGLGRVWIVVGIATTVTVLATLATLAVVLMAVVPGWPINKQGQRNTGEAVGGINEVSVLAAFCAHQHTELHAIRVCVAGGMEQLKEKP